MNGPVRRLHWGCGETIVPGWINADRRAGPGVELAGDIRYGLPLESYSIDYIVSIHALQDLPYFDVVPALQELRRVLAPGGVLRLGLPDMDRAIDAYLRNDADYFYVPDSDSATTAGKMIIQLTWYGDSRIMFTYDFAREMLGKAGFRTVTRCAYRQTVSRFAEIVALDNRERETLFVEAQK
jgi:predicted SAM-dependent methyltransferase